LALSALGQGDPVVVSRGELVEIGGGFRIPDIVRATGSPLVEVGTTNRTTLDDYRLQQVSLPSLLLKIHLSNYRMTGFTESVAIESLVTLGQTVIFDIGSGLLDATTPWLEGDTPRWLSGEPAARQALAAGAALVTFSCDKLFGGPQAGVIAGRADLVNRCLQHPLYRVVRPGEMTLSVLQNTALSYLRRDGLAIPFWRLASTRVETLWERAEKLGTGSVVLCKSPIGGGALPGIELDSVGVAYDGDFAGSLRAGPVPVIARIEDGRTIVDLRAVNATEDETLSEMLRLSRG
jgi:L-seryl-tRNA(Ser) seleniumtransferase